MWFAISHDEGLVIGEHANMQTCMVYAEEWLTLRGESADAYYLTTDGPSMCDVCGGTGVFDDYGESGPCYPCRGTGYAQSFAKGAGNKRNKEQ